MKIAGGRAISLSIGAISLLVAGVVSISPMTSGASDLSTSLSGKPYPSLGNCPSGASKAYVLPYANIKGMSRTSIAETFGKAVVEPIVTEPIENHVATKPFPAVTITESLHNSTLPWYTDSSSTEKVRSDPTAISEFIETIALFRSANREQSYLQQISKVDQSQFLVPGKNRIRVVYLGASSQVSVRNSVYRVTTTMPGAPVLVFYTLWFGSFVTTFAFYGGSALDVARTSHYVNLGMQMVFGVCS